MLGPRQTGKTTFIRTELKPDLEISFVKKADRLRYEKNPELLELEIADLVATHGNIPVIFIDEVQKIPSVMDSIQYIIDNNTAQFILSGSSARKLKHGNDINLLPGRVVVLYLSPLTCQEIPDIKLTDILLYGSLPGIILEHDPEDREIDLNSYVTTYLEDEVRSEALVRNVGNFANFLQLSAGESGKSYNMSNISQDIGVAVTTISNYLQILDDCLIVHKIEPLTHSISKRRLIHAPRYLFFDLGIRRLCANEGIKLPAKLLGDLFEQYIGLQLIACKDLYKPTAKIRYWRDSAGPEVDYVLDVESTYIPIEVKWSTQPTLKDAKHLNLFLSEYSNATTAYIICQTPRAYTLSTKPLIKVLPWGLINEIFESLD